MWAEDGNVKENAMTTPPPPGSWLALNPHLQPPPARIYGQTARQQQENMAPVRRDWERLRREDEAAKARATAAAAALWRPQPEAAPEPIHVRVRRAVRTVLAVVLAIGALPFLATSLVRDWPGNLFAAAVFGMLSWWVAPRRKGRHARP